MGCLGALKILLQLNARHVAYYLVLRKLFAQVGTQQRPGSWEQTIYAIHSALKKKSYHTYCGYKSTSWSPDRLPVLTYFQGINTRHVESLQCVSVSLSSHTISPTYAHASLRRRSHYQSNSHQTKSLLADVPPPSLNSLLSTHTQFDLNHMFEWDKSTSSLSVFNASSLSIPY